MKLLEINHLLTTPYHPMCNGLVENFNGILKQMLRKLCSEQPKTWNKYLDPLLFAYREVPQESTGFSPFELLYGRTVRGPLQLLKELWTENIDGEIRNVYEYVINLKDKLESTMNIAKDNLEKSQNRQKYYYDRRSKENKIGVGDQVLVLLPTNNNKLTMQWKGPFAVIDKPYKNDFKIQMKKKTRTFHANMLKKYIERESEKQQARVSSIIEYDENCLNHEEMVKELETREFTESTKEDFDINPSLSQDQTAELKNTLNEYSSVFKRKPGLAAVEDHKIILTTNKPITSKAYPCSAFPLEICIEEGTQRNGIGRYHQEIKLTLCITCGTCEEERLFVKIMPGLQKTEQSNYI